MILIAMIGLIVIMIGDDLGILNHFYFENRP